MKDNVYTCIVTGETKYVAPSVAQKKIEKFGSELEYRKHFILPAVASLLRRGQTVDEIRQSYGITHLPTVNPLVLTKLNLVRRKKGLRAIEAQEKLDRDKYLRSPEYREKMSRIKHERDNMSERQYVEMATGGPGRCQVDMGGTCHRPDIFLEWNNRACDGCPYYEYCLCYNRRLSTEKKKPKKR